MKYRIRRKRFKKQQQINTNLLNYYGPFRVIKRAYLLTKAKSSLRDSLLFLIRAAGIGANATFLRSGL